MIWVINEILRYFKFRKSVKEIENTSEMWKTFRFNSGWFKQFGAIVRINKQDIINNSGYFDNTFVKYHIVNFLDPFIDDLKLFSLYDAVRMKIEPVMVFGVREYVFYKVTFWYVFPEHYINRIKYIFYILIIFFIFLIFKTQIFNIFKGIF